MLVVNCNSVSEALSKGLLLLRRGVASPSRVGSVLVNPMPVMTVYHRPENRVLFSPMRDANPFFHVMESLWMLAGRNDLPWLVRFNSRFSSFSDDGGATQPGAYGYRWREYFGHDQLVHLVNELKRDPTSRRCVLSMWDPGHSPDSAGDLGAAFAGSADVPCNTHAYFDTMGGKLNMTVCCRSNDIIWGAYGANAVHFSFLLEYMAAATGIPMGVYRQFSNNYHIYTSVVPVDKMEPMAEEVRATDKYQKNEGYLYHLMRPELRRVPLVRDATLFEREIVDFIDKSNQAYAEPFLETVAAPMYGAYMMFKAKDLDGAIERALDIKDEAWRIACTEWLQRRKDRQNGAA